ncbi:MAG: anti-sigma F factor [Anaerovoracaceae bacterium]
MKPKEIKNRVKVEMEARSENESLARTVASAFSAAWDPTVEELTEIKTAVSEAVSNAIIHAYPNEDKVGSIMMEMSGTEDGHLFFTIEDEGIGIRDIEKAKEPLFTTGAPEERSGMGFTVMESFMDHLGVESVDGKGTRITMVKILGSISVV